MFEGIDSTTIDKIIELRLDDLDQFQYFYSNTFDIFEKRGYTIKHIQFAGRSLEVTDISKRSYPFKVTVEHPDKDAPFELFIKFAPENYLPEKTSMVRDISITHDLERRLTPEIARNLVPLVLHFGYNRTIKSTPFGSNDHQEAVFSWMISESAGTVLRDIPDRVERLKAYKKVFATASILPQLGIIPADPHFGNFTDEGKFIEIGSSTLITTLSLYTMVLNKEEVDEGGTEDILLPNTKAVQPYMDQGRISKLKRNLSVTGLAAIKAAYDEENMHPLATYYGLQCAIAYHFLSIFFPSQIIDFDEDKYKSAEDIDSRNVFNPLRTPRMSGGALLEKLYDGNTALGASVYDSIALGKDYSLEQREQMIRTLTNILLDLGSLGGSKLDRDVSGKIATVCIDVYFGLRLDATIKDVFIPIIEELGV